VVRTAGIDQLEVQRLATIIVIVGRLIDWRNRWNPT
jgi:hypothetical protein